MTIAMLQLNGFDEDGDGVSSCAGDCNDQDASLNLLDEDGDGVTSCGGDCNDLDDQIAVDTDKDGDGYLGCTEDCDDGIFTNFTCWKRVGS